MHLTFAYIRLIYKAFKIQIILFSSTYYNMLGGIMCQIMHK